MSTIDHNLPDDRTFPILFLTGISFARSADEQERWQSLHDRKVRQLLDAWSARRGDRYRTKSTGVVREFMRQNPFLPLVEG